MPQALELRSGQQQGMREGPVSAWIVMRESAHKAGDCDDLTSGPIASPQIRDALGVAAIAENQHAAPFRHNSC
eukprot:CAMPEP_0180525012 /NCGR_PEP_ID=MMETSP1036_2-20121128/58935_1 /TAXON_ID=632150 /ORGANISM="Azadinium spinosum, Strain 3D9" /LENGTH=72 /DNA_ID=CAMNT_0022538271 /DNA_START=138 /DNA_END=353 /DNA_ORIENTATION=-